MARKRNSVSCFWLFTWLLLGSLILFSVPQSVTGNLQLAFTRVFSLPLSMGRNMMLAVPMRRGAEGEVSLREIDQLRNHVANLTQSLEEEREKCAHLSALRQQYRTLLEGAAICPAEVVQVSLAGATNQMIINRGAEDGIAVGQYVLGLNNVIGRVSKVNNRIAEIALFSDVASTVPVYLPSGEIESMMQGAGDGKAKVKFVPNDKPVSVGDAVYADKKPGFLDAAVIIGSVVDAKYDKENPFLWDVTVRFSCEVEQLRRVDVIIMIPQQTAKTDANGKS